MAKIDLTLNLINKISGQSKQIGSDLENITKQAKQLEDALSLKGLKTKLVNNYMKSVINDIRKANGELDKKPKDWTVGAIAAGGIIKDTFESVVKSFYHGIKSVLDLIGQAEQTQIGLKYQAPGMVDVINQSVKAFSGISGQGENDIEQQMLPLLQALHGRSGAAAMAIQMREAAQDMSVMLGHGTGDTALFVDVFQRVMNREGLQARQLQRLGVNEHDFFTQMGKNLGVTEKTAEVLAKDGRYADDVRNSLLRYIADKQGGKTGNVSKEYSESFAGRVEKLQALPADILKGLVTDKSEALKRINDTLGDIYTWVMKNKELIANSFLRVLTKVADVLPKIFNEENIDRWSNMLSEAATVVGFLVEHFKGLFEIMQVIGTVALGFKIINWGIPVLEGLTAALPGLGTTLGVIAAGFAAAAAPILAVVAALTSVGFAIYRIVEAVKELGGLSRVWKDFKDWAGGDKPAIATGLPAPLKTQIHFTTKQAEAEYQSQGMKTNIEQGKFAGGAIGFNGIGAPNAKPTNGMVHNFAPVLNINVGAGGEDATHTAQQISQQTTDQMSRMFEQSLYEMGSR